MKCPKCKSTSYRKNGHRSGKQNYLCKICGRQFLDSSSQISNDKSRSSNGHLQTSLAEVRELALIKQLPEETKVIISAEELLQMLSDDWLESSTFRQFIQKFQHVTKQSDKPTSGIAILLLDAENIKLDINSEIFLTSLSKYPLQVKIAFANWRNPASGKQDSELYERGYQLVHVPGGKDSADAKMIALGSSIFQQYRTVKEVFVCSCDGILTHLCNQLQSQGLTVYWVRRQNPNLIIVENCNTAQVNHYSLAMETGIPSFAEFVHKIEELIQAEQKSTTERLSSLSTITTLFQERCNITNFSNKSLAIVQAHDEVVAIGVDSPQAIVEKQNLKSNTTSTIKNIESIEALEKLILKLIRKMAVETKREYVSVIKLKTLFQTQFKETADATVKQFKPDSSLIKFLRALRGKPASLASRPTLFKLALVGNQYEVKLVV
jgi:hypothetical protein